MHISARFSRTLLRFTMSRLRPRRRGRRLTIEEDVGPPTIVEERSPALRVAKQPPPMWAAVPPTPQDPTTFSEAWVAHSAGLALAARHMSHAPTPSSLARCLKQGGHLLTLLAPRSAEYRHDIDKLAVSFFTVATRVSEVRALSDAREDLRRLAFQVSGLFRSLFVSAAHSLTTPLTDDQTSKSTPPD